MEGGAQVQMMHDVRRHHAATPERARLACRWAVSTSAIRPTPHECADAPHTLNFVLLKRYIIYSVDTVYARVIAS